MWQIKKARVHVSWPRPSTLALALVNHFIELYTFLLALLGFITYTVLCKRNANEIRCFSFFVLAKIRRNFVTNFRQSAREFSLSQTKFRRYLDEISHQLKRNFGIAKIRSSEISP